MHDVVVIGGGPAGLSAAIVLARAGRTVMVFDSSRPRNYAARELHNFLGHDSISPLELLRLGRSEAEKYGVELVASEINHVGVVSPREAGFPTGFRVRDADEMEWTARKLVFATGVVDVLPDIPGFRRLYGQGVFHCPYCDGWKYRGQRLAAFGKGKKALGIARLLRSWSDKITVLTDAEDLSKEEAAFSERLGFLVKGQRVMELRGSGCLESVVLDGAGSLDCEALFFNADKIQRSVLPLEIGCIVNDRGEYQTRARQRTCIPGVFLAGDADGDVQFAVVAAGEGATVGVAVNSELQREDEARF